jgi:transposase-like protein
VVEAFEAEVEALLLRRFDDARFQVIYIDRLLFCDDTVIAAMGVDREGKKHVLGIREGAREYSTAADKLLANIGARASIRSRRY